MTDPYPKRPPSRAPSQYPVPPRVTAKVMGPAFGRSSSLVGRWDQAGLLSVQAGERRPEGVPVGVCLDGQEVVEAATDRAARLRGVDIGVDVQGFEAVRHTADGMDRPGAPHEGLG